MLRLLHEEYVSTYKDLLQIAQLETTNAALECHVRALEEKVTSLEDEAADCGPVGDYEAALKVKDDFIQRLGKETREIRKEVTQLVGVSRTACSGVSRTASASNTIS